MSVRFSGHESFACRYAWLPKALLAIQAEPEIFSDEERAMAKLGVGKNMVRSIRFWVEAAGMAQHAKSPGLVPTPLGSAIFGPDELDPFLEDIQTLWLIHWKLCSRVDDPLFAWEFLFSRWQEPDFTESGVLRAFSRETQTQSRKLSSATLQQHFQVFLHTYVPSRGPKSDIAEDNLDCPLTELDLIVKIGERDTSQENNRRESIYSFKREDKPSISPALFAYCLSDYWAQRFGNENTLSVTSISNGMSSPGQVFKIPEENIYSRLEDISDVTDGAFQYQESSALPQVHRKRSPTSDKLLRKVYR
jgi:hypothetical protein